MLEVSAHAFTCDAIFPMVIFLHDVFMYIEMIMLHPALSKVLHAQRYIDGVMHSLYSLSK